MIVKLDYDNNSFLNDYSYQIIFYQLTKIYLLSYCPVLVTCAQVVSNNKCHFFNLILNLIERFKVDWQSS